MSGVLSAWACGSDGDQAGVGTEAPATLPADAGATGPGASTPLGDGGNGAGTSDAGADAAAAVNPSWMLEVVASDLDRPWSLSFAPDGRMLFTTRDDGRVGVLDVTSGAVSYLATALPVRAGGEGGMLGMDLDPEFATNGFAYVCYTYESGGAKNRVSRVTLTGGALTNETVLLDGMPGGDHHDGCRVVVGPDGLLYVSMGESTQRPLAQDPTSLGGKILRIARTGAIPTDNPFPGSAVYTLGHRNPQGLGFQPGTNVLWSTEHGDTTRDELNVIVAGKNYGWPTCEGTQSCAVANYAPALREYETASTVAISDLVFYTGDVFPAWKGSLFFVTLKTGRLYRVTVDATPKVLADEILVENTFGRLRDVTMGPDGFLYMSTDSGNGSRIIRLRPKT